MEWASNTSPGSALQRGAEIGRAFARIGYDVFAAVFHARLDDEGDDALESSADAGGRKRLAMRVRRANGGVRAGHLQRRNVLVRAARDRYLGSDDIVGNDAGGCRGPFRHGSKARGTGRYRRFGQWSRIAAAGHAGVEMDLGEPGRHEGRYHALALLHGLVRRQRLPRIRAEMVATEHNAFARQSDLRRNAEDEIAEGHRRHPGVAAAVVDLVAGRLDQHGAAVVRCVLQRRLDDEGVGRADRGDAGSAAIGRRAGKVRECVLLHNGPSGQVQRPRSVRKGLTLVTGVCRRSQEST